MPTNEEIYAGSQYYRVVGNWALSDITVDAVKSDLISSANATGSVPANAVLIELRGVVQGIATGVADTELSATVQSHADGVAAGSKVDTFKCNMTEPSGLTPGTVVGDIPFQMVAYIDNHVTDPEFRLIVTLNDTKVTQFAIIGYWMP